MRSASDPISKLRRWSRLIWLAAAPPLVAVGWYALDVPTATPIIVHAAPDNDAGDSEGGSERPLELAAFDAPVWVAPPQPEESVAERPSETVPSQQTRLQLIGIVSETDPTSGGLIHLAALFDPDSFEMHVVKSGDTIGGFSVETVEAGGVRLTEGGRQTWLEIEDWRISGGSS